jgi:hypothetical protein
MRPSSTLNFVCLGGTKRGYEMPTIEPEFCAQCKEKLSPDEAVTEAVEVVDARALQGPRTWSRI